MRRAILVATGTAAGLASVLTYSPGHGQPAASGDSHSVGLAAGLGAPVAAPSPAPTVTVTPGPAPTPVVIVTVVAVPAGSTVADVTGAPVDGGGTVATPPPDAVAAPAPSGAAPKAKQAKKQGTQAPTVAGTAATHKAAPAPTPKATPAPAAKAPSGPTDYVGPAVSNKYGTVQVGIRVHGRTLVDVWAVTFPTGSSQPYSEMAIPLLREQTMAARSARIAGATGASFTTQSWKTSLAGALAKAHL